MLFYIISSFFLYCYYSTAWIPYHLFSYWWIFGLFSSHLQQWIPQKTETVFIKSLEAFSSYGLKSGDISTERNLSEREQHESKSFAFVFRWPSNLIDPNQSLKIKANCITRISCTSNSTSYLLNHLTGVIQIWMNFKGFSCHLRVWLYTWACSL